MEVPVGFPREVTFLVLRAYLTARLDKILASNRPSHIEAELNGFYLEKGKLKQEIYIGSWRGFLARSKGNAKGTVKATVEDMNGDSCVHFKFSFAKEYKPYLIAFGALTAALNGLVGYLATTSPSSEATLGIFAILNIVLLVFGAFLLFSVFWNTSLTEATFIEGFEEFADMFSRKGDSDSATNLLVRR